MLSLYLAYRIASSARTNIPRSQYRSRVSSYRSAALGPPYPACTVCAYAATARPVRPPLCENQTQQTSKHPYEQSGPKRAEIAAVGVWFRDRVVGWFRGRVVGPVKMPALLPPMSAPRPLSIIWYKHTQLSTRHYTTQTHLVPTPYATTGRVIAA